jgi:D-3-phosphoglycerate dehydrogenase / 2-oxoglutarate reductase
LTILHIDSNHPLLIEQLSALGHINHEDYQSSKSEITQKISEYDGIVIRSRFKIDKPFLDAAINLKFIARVGSGMENIDCDYARSKGIHLIAAPEGNCNAVGEHALGMLLALTNKFKKSQAEIELGQWLREDNRGEELEGKTIGIIGYGHTGKAFAKKLKGFDANVIYYDIKDDVQDSNATPVSLLELQQTADVLSLHVPLTPLTDKMVNIDFIRQFKKPFYLLNTARGQCVVIKDVLQALDNSSIKGAGLDVLEYEKSSFETLNPPADFKKLLFKNNVILTPHVAGWSQESKVKLAQTIVDKFRGIFH